LNETTPARLKRLAKVLYKPVTIAAMHPWRRWHPGARYIGVTGSAGKTTTKDLLVAALGGRPDAIGNSDSNNQIFGVARTLVNVSSSTRYVVQEVGAGEPGGIDRMMRLLQPQVGIVLNVGLDHRGSFGGVEEIAAEKARLVAALPADGLAVLCADDERVAAMAAHSRAPVITFGFNAGDVRGRVLPQPWGSGLAIEVQHQDRRDVFHSKLSGPQHAPNLLAAVATATSLGVPAALLDSRLAGVSSMLGRASLQIVDRDIHVVRDDWKAPAWSLSRSFDMLRAAGGRRRYVVLGTLSDYPGNSRSAYRRAIALALENAERVILVGARASHAANFAATHPGRISGCETVHEAANLLKGELRGGEIVLLKGSNRADHLARLALELEGKREVRCWRTRCGLDIFCDNCALLGREAR
jgi:UDP-N-acetylmuramoyl-tripeptide--D-alanyl-D-alanine ligase